MAKTWKKVSFESMVTKERMEIAIHRASEHKRSSLCVQRFASNDVKKQKLLDELKDGTYTPHMPVPKIIFDSRSNKERTIVRPIFRDQIVHHMIMLEIESYCKGYVINHTVACMQNRGIHYAQKMLRYWTTKKAKQCRYIIQADVKHYYQTVDIDILEDFFKHKIRDKKFLALLHLFFEQFRETGEGLFLGYYLCQWFGTMYLASVDHFIKEKLGCTCYLRYVDNMMLGFRTKKLAISAMKSVVDALSAIGLQFKQTGKECMRMFKWAHNFVDFVGYRTYRKGFQELRKRTYLRYHRNMLKLQRSDSCSASEARSFLSRYGLIVHSSCEKLLSDSKQLIASKRLKQRMVA